MKTIIKVTLVIALVAFANTLYASKFSNLRVGFLPLEAEGKAVVEISTSGKSNFKITVVDNKNRIIFSNGNAEPIDNYRVQYDYSKLNDGVYKLAVISDDLTTERSFRINHGAIKVGKEKMILKPFFGYKDGIVRCSYLNFSKENMTLHFMMEDQLIYTKELGNIFKLNEALNLANMNPGSYEAVLTAGNKEYSYKIDKK